MFFCYKYCDVPEQLTGCLQARRYFNLGTEYFCKAYINFDHTTGHQIQEDGLKGKAVPLHAWTGPEGSRKLRFPDFVTTAQDGGRLSALHIGHLTPWKYSRYSFLLGAESTPGP